MLLVVVLAIVIQQAIFKRLRDAPVMTTTLVTIGLSILLEHLALLLWGPQPQAVPTPFPTKPLSFFGIYTTPLYLFSMAVTAALIVVGHVLIQRTRMGKAMRATFQNREAAALVGVRIDRVYSMPSPSAPRSPQRRARCWAASSRSSPTMGGIATLKAFVVVILGGMGSFVGAIVGGLLLGLAEALGAGYFSTGWKDAIGFVAVILLLYSGPTACSGVLDAQALMPVVIGIVLAGLLMRAAGSCATTITCTFSSSRRFSWWSRSD